MIYETIRVTFVQVTGERMILQNDEFYSLLSDDTKEDVGNIHF
jgi:hypothetical protein